MFKSLKSTVLLALVVLITSCASPATGTTVTATDLPTATMTPTQVPPTVTPSSEAPLAISWLKTYGGNLSDGGYPVLPAGECR